MSIYLDLARAGKLLSKRPQVRPLVHPSGTLHLISICSGSHGIELWLRNPAVRDASGGIGYVDVS